jgi:hypothetical protein
MTADYNIACPRFWWNVKRQPAKEPRPHDYFVTISTLPSETTASKGLLVRSQQDVGNLLPSVANHPSWACLVSAAADCPSVLPDAWARFATLGSDTTPALVRKSVRSAKPRVLNGADAQAQKVRPPIGTTMACPYS